MFDSSKLVSKDEEEMEDFHDYEDEEHSELDSKLDDYEEEELEEEDDEEEELEAYFGDLMDKINKMLADWKQFLETGKL